MKRKLWLGPAIALVAALVYRAYHLTAAISPANAISLFLTLCWQDLYPLPIVVLLVSIGAISSSRCLRVIVSLLAVSCTTMFAIDTFVLVATNEHAAPASLLLALRERHMISGFIRITAIVALLVMAGVIWWRLTIRDSEIFALSASALLVLTLRALFPPHSVLHDLSRYSIGAAILPFLPSLKDLPHTEPSSGGAFGPAELIPNSYKDSFSIPDGSPNVVVVVVESLSAADSFRTSGLYDRLPRFDQISREGLLFQNALANDRNSEGGHIALLTGRPPIPIHGGISSGFASYGRFPAYPAWLRARGYRTVALQGCSLRDYYSGHFYVATGFEETLGLDEMRLRFPSAAGIDPYLEDNVLFDIAKEKIQADLSSKIPFFYYIATLGTHEPRRDRETGVVSEEAGWGRFDADLAQFYEALKSIRYFEHGVLIILGDHRKRAPPSESERLRYGTSAPARIPLMLVGAGIPSRIDDRLLQQSDLFRTFSRLSAAREELSTYGSFVDNRISLHGSRVLIFLPPHRPEMPLESAVIAVRPEALEWEAGAPDFGAVIESDFMRQRHLGRILARDSRRPCAFVPALPHHSELHGVRAEFFPGTNIQDTQISNTVLHTSILPSFNYLQDALAGTGLRENFSVQFTGYLKIEQGGRYQLSADADDGLCMAIGGREILSGNEIGLVQDMRGEVLLEPGLHPFEIRYFNGYSSGFLHIKWMPPGMEDWQEIPPSALFAPIDHPRHGATNGS